MTGSERKVAAAEFAAVDVSDPIQVETWITGLHTGAGLTVDGGVMSGV